MDSTATPAITPEDADVARAVRVLALLAEPTRFRIILATQYGPMSVNHLADIVERSPAAVSQHLAKLRAAGDWSDASPTETRPSTQPSTSTPSPSPTLSLCKPSIMPTALLLSTTRVKTLPSEEGRACLCFLRFVISPTA